MVNNTLRFKFFIVVVALTMTLAACGYRFAGEGRLPGNTRSVFVDVLENRTGETGVENIFTADLRYEFVRNDMMAKREVAGGILTGVIKSMRVETISRQGQHIAQERRVTAVLDLRLLDRDDKIIWKVDGISASEAYNVSAQDKTAVDTLKSEAIQKLSKQLAQLVYYRLLDDF